MHATGCVRGCMRISVCVYVYNIILIHTYIYIEIYASTHTRIQICRHMLLCPNQPATCSLAVVPSSLLEAPTLENLRVDDRNKHSL